MCICLIYMYESLALSLACITSLLLIQCFVDRWRWCHLSYLTIGWSSIDHYELEEYITKRPAVYITTSVDGMLRLETTFPPITIAMQGNADFL